MTPHVSAQPSELFEAAPRVPIIIATGTACRCAAALQLSLPFPPQAFQPGDDLGMSGGEIRSFRMDRPSN